MKKLNRLIINICSEDLARSKAFYTSLFDLEVNFDSDWFIHLLSEDKTLKLGIVDSKSDILPNGIEPNAKGIYITFVVDDAEAIFELAKQQSFEIQQEPEDTFYGQRRLLLKDPNGVVIDVSSPIPDFNP